MRPTVTKKLTYALALILGLLVVGLYADTLAFLSQWWRMQELWRFFVVPIFFYMIIMNLRSTGRQAPVPAPVIGATVLTVAAALFVAGTAFGIDVCRELSLVLCIAGLTLLVLGISYCKRWFIPIVYLLIMTTLFEKGMSFLAFYFEHITAFLSTHALGLMGFTVLHEGTFLTLPGVKLEIVRECSGVNMLSAMIGTGVPFAYVRHRRMMSVLIFTASILPLTLLFNTIRIILIALWNYGGLRESIHGPHEILLLPVLYPFALVTLLWFSHVLRRHESNVPARIITAGPSVSLVRPLMAACVALAVTGIIAAVISPRPIALPTAPDPIQAVDGWQLLPAQPTQSAGFTFDRPDAEVFRSYQDSTGCEINLYIGYFARQSATKRLLEHSYNWLSGTIDTLLVSDSLVINKAVVTAQKQIVGYAGYWYNIDGTVCLTKETAKRLLTTNVFRKQRNNGALVRIAIDADQPGAHDGPQAYRKIGAFTAVALPSINQFLDLQ